MEGYLLGNQAVWQMNDGHFEAAKEGFEQAIKIARQIGNRDSEGKNLGNLGTLYLSRGDDASAREHYRAAMTISKHINNQRWEGYWLGLLANVAKTQHDYAHARAGFERAITIARRFNDRYDEGLHLQNLGHLDIIEARYDDADRHLSQALEIAAQTGNQRRLTVCTRLHIQLDIARGKFNTTRHAIEREMTRLQQRDDPPSIAKLLCERGLLDLAQHLPDNAQEALETLDALAVDFAEGDRLDLEAHRQRLILALQTYKGH